MVLGDEEDLAKAEALISKINWIKYDGISDGMEAITKIRYKDNGAASILYNEGNDIVVQFTDLPKV